MNEYDSLNCTFERQSQTTKNEQFENYLLHKNFIAHYPLEHDFCP